MNFREKYDKNKSSILSIKEVDIINRIKKGEYHYDCEFVGSISNGWHEGEDGMYYYVELYGANEDSAFAFHTFIITVLINNAFKTVQQSTKDKEDICRRA